MTDHADKDVEIAATTTNIRASADLRTVFTAQPLDEDLDAYWSAPYGDGPLAFTWEDKPYRLVYRLIAALLHADAEIAVLKSEVARLSEEVEHYYHKAVIDEGKGRPPIAWKDRAESAEARVKELEAGLREMIRLADMGYEASLREPEENGNFAAYERARALLQKDKNHEDL